MIGVHTTIADQEPMISVSRRLLSEFRTRYLSVSHLTSDPLQQEPHRLFPSPGSEYVQGPQHSTGLLRVLEIAPGTNCPVVASKSGEAGRAHSAIVDFSIQARESALCQ